MKKSNAMKLIIPVCAGLVVCAAGIFLLLDKFSHKEVAEGEIYFAEGHLTKMEAPLNEKMVDYASNRFFFIYENYLKPENIKPYLSIIPDKNYYLTEDGQTRKLDYNALITKVVNDNSYMEYIDITDLLSLEDYYYTDSHWKQENITDVAERLAGVMGATLVDSYEKKQFEKPFYGVYFEEGESRVKPDTINYLDSEILKACTVEVIGEKKQAFIYDANYDKLESAYDMFLSGPEAVLSIVNPNASSDKKLIVFRDSFGSSLIPLMVSGYKNITLIDIRYVQSQMLGQLVDFSDADVLFLYSTLLLNSSMGMK